MIINSNFATYLAPAKLNLGLKIVGKRNDGYHLLKTIFCLVDLFDEINIQITSNAKISIIEHNQVWPYYEDLTYKIANKLRELTNTNLGANIKIRKTIPSGAGMGGGSSDAATVLIVLNKLWNINLPIAELTKIGLEFGADIPFFIFGHNAIATGVGEHITPIALPKTFFVVVKPSFHIPTKNIFRAVAIDQSKIDINTITPEFLVTTQENDLFSVALKLYPQLKNIVNNMSIFGTPAMTGSGSGLYLSFADKKVAKKVAKCLENSYNTYLIESLNKSPIM